MYLFVFDFPSKEDLTSRRQFVIATHFLVNEVYVNFFQLRRPARGGSYSKLFVSSNFLRRQLTVCRVTKIPSEESSALISE